MTWHEFTGSAEAWDQLVIRLGAPTPFQLSAWSAFRESFGWRCLRLVTADFTSAVCLLVKSIGPVSVAWGPGAPLGAVDAITLRELPTDAKLLLHAKVLYLRVADQGPLVASRVEAFQLAGWLSPATPLGGNKTLVRSLDISSPLSTSYSSNWSRNLRRGHQRKINATLWLHPDSEKIARLHRDVENLKKPFHAGWRSDGKAVARVLAAFGNGVVTVRAQDTTGETLSIRAATLVGTNAFDFLAATSHEGRKNYASNVALDALLTTLVSRGITRYDFGGVDEIHNRGVFDFKHGAGGEHLSYNGEFETTVPKTLHQVVAKLISSRLN